MSYVCVTEQIKMLTGYTARPEFLKKLTYIAVNHHPKVTHVDTLRAFHFGSNFLVEVHIVLPADMTLLEAHDIGESLQTRLERLNEVERAFVHIDHEVEHHPHSEHKVVWPPPALGVQCHPIPFSHSTPSFCRFHFWPLPLHRSIIYRGGTCSSFRYQKLMQFLEHVTCCLFFWYQKLAPNRTRILFDAVRVSGTRNLCEIASSSWCMKFVLVSCRSSWYQILECVSPLLGNSPLGSFIHLSHRWST